MTTDGEVLSTGQDIKDGQNVWQSIGGQTVGSIWGHGAYIAPDWTADYLHREASLLLEELAKKDGKTYSELPDEEQARYEILLKKNCAPILLMKKPMLLSFHLNGPRCISN